MNRLGILVAFFVISIPSTAWGADTAIFPISSHQLKRRETDAIGRTIANAYARFSHRSVLVPQATQYAAEASNWNLSAAAHRLGVSQYLRIKATRLTDKTTKKLIDRIKIEVSLHRKDGNEIHRVTAIATMLNDLNLVSKYIAQSLVLCLSINELQDRNDVGSKPVKKGSAYTLYLRNGHVLNGELIENVTDRSAAIRFADGTVRKFDWKDIDRVESDTNQPVKPIPALCALHLKPKSIQGPDTTERPIPTIHYETRLRYGVPSVYVPGFISFGVSWGSTVAVAAFYELLHAIFDRSYDEADSVHIDLIASGIPLVGPWIGLASKDTLVPDVLWVTAGTFQAIGIGVAILGLFLKQRRFVAIKDVIKRKETTTAYVTPIIMGSKGIGLGFTLSN